MHETQGMLVVLVGFVLVFALSAIQLAAIYLLFGLIDFSAPKSVDALAKLVVIIISVVEVVWILNRIPVK